MADSDAQAIDYELPAADAIDAHNVSVLGLYHWRHCRSLLAKAEVGRGFGIHDSREIALLLKPSHRRLHVVQRYLAKHNHAAFGDERRSLLYLVIEILL